MKTKRYANRYTNLLCCTLIFAGCCRQVPPPLLTTKAAGRVPQTQMIQTPAGVWQIEQSGPDSIAVILHPATKEQRKAAKAINKAKRLDKKEDRIQKSTEAANKIDTIKAETTQAAVKNLPLSLFFLLLIVAILAGRRIFESLKPR